MKCKMCGGAGVIQGQAPGIVSCCPACDGKGFIEQTNEEWLRSCTTEQLVSFLLWYPNNVHGYPKPKMSIAEEEDAIREWLKQPRKSVTNCNE